MSFHQPKQSWCRNIIVSIQLISVGKCQYRMPQRNHLQQLLELLLPGVWGKHLIIDVCQSWKKWWQTSPSFTSGRLHSSRSWKKTHFYGERIWKRHPNRQYLTKSSDAFNTTRRANQATLQQETAWIRKVSIKIARIPCFKSHVWSQTKPSRPKPPKGDLDLLQDDVCQSGSCLGIPKPQNHLRSCSSYSTHVCKLSWRFLHSLHSCFTYLLIQLKWSSAINSGSFWSENSEASRVKCSIIQSQKLPPHTHDPWSGIIKGQSWAS